MARRSPVPTYPIWAAISPPDAAGWQTSYLIGLQGKRPVVMGVMTSCSGGTPRGGLTAQTARARIRTGEALREFMRALAKRRELADGSEAGVEVGRGAWRHEPQSDYARYLRVVEAMPQLARFAIERRHRRGLTRDERLAETAVLYHAAVAAGDRAPKRRVARLQKRPWERVRDDLHRARIARPPLLTSPGPGRVGGEPTDRAMSIWNAAHGEDATRTGRARPAGTQNAKTKGGQRGKTRKR